VSRGLAESRTRAQALIMAGAVFSGERKLSKAGDLLAEDAALDVGSSTGGFTDVLLSRGAAKVYAVDVGTNQLAWKLRQDPRVIVHEQTNARTLGDSIVTEPVDVIVCDASFISLAKVLEAPLRLAKPGAKLVALIKPQFEAGREEVGKGGVVRDPAVHERVCTEAKAWVESQGWNVLGVTPSPITGPEGNVEFLLAAVKND
jgi:23S rRNA (cytidine1920-2'-O)/16S rRNA (cytidine1409-2'-O)-methyltransferase